LSRIDSLELLAPPFRDRLAGLLLKINEDGIPLDVFETARSPQRQMQLYARGRDPALPDYGRTVTRALPYHSAHQHGMAADLVFKVAGNWTWDEPEPGLWRRLGELAAAAGLETLSFEKPHVQIAGFVAKEIQPGPPDTVGWMAWLQGQIAPALV
jgi:peptidoglycan L-alanyl-D-glutamate endopeptidase CwlK